MTRLFYLSLIALFGCLQLAYAADAPDFELEDLDGEDVAEAERFEVGEGDPAHRRRGMGQRVGPAVAECVGIGQRAHADAVQHDHEHATVR